MTTIHSVIDNFAALHYHHWNDKSNFDKFPYLTLADHFNGENEEGYK